MEDRIFKIYLAVFSLLCGIGAFFCFRFSLGLFDEFKYAEDLVMKALLFVGGGFMILISLSLLLAIVVMVWAFIIMTRDEDE